MLCLYGKNMNFYEQAEKHFKKKKSNFFKKLIFLIILISMITIISISLIISFTEIFTEIFKPLITFIIVLIIGFFLLYKLGKSEHKNFISYLKDILSKLEEYFNEKENEKDFYKRDPKEFDFKEILSLSNDEEKKALEKFSGINFKSLDKFDIAVRKKSTDDISLILKRIQGVNKELAIASYTDIINIVAEKFKLSRDIRNDVELERHIVNTQFSKMVEKMDKKERKLLEDEIKKYAEKTFGKKHLNIALTSGGIVAANLGAFSTYTMATSLIGGLTSALGVTLPFAFYTTLTSTMSVLIGPLGVSLLAAWGIRKVTKPNISVSVLIVLSISAIRERLIFEYDEKLKEINSEFESLKIEKEKLENLQSKFKSLSVNNLVKILLANNKKEAFLQIAKHSN
tara:strand:- start:248 stop:1444 length:1197 start_codon:yes stop_codon:yes gene_type:complete